MLEELKRFEDKRPEVVFEWKDSETEAEGWVVINSLRSGAAGGGTRMRKGLDKHEVTSLAKTMEVKFTVSGPQIGGAKSGINFDPADPRKKGVLERRNLQDTWPDARITWIIGKTEATLMGDIPDVEFITFDKAQGLAAYRHVGRHLAGMRFDVALCMHASMRANLLCREIPAAVRVGFDKARARDFQWLFTSQRIPAAKGEHALDAMMGFARFIGAQPTDLRWDIPIDADDRAFARTHCGDRTVVISPCSSQRSRNYRNWPVDRYVDVVRHLRDSFGITIEPL